MASITVAQAITEMKTAGSIFNYVINYHKIMLSMSFSIDFSSLMLASVSLTTSTCDF